MPQRNNRRKKSWRTPKRKPANAWRRRIRPLCSAGSRHGSRPSGRSQDLLAQAQAQSEEEGRAIRDETAEACEAIRRQAAGKMEEAVEFIMRRVVSGEWR